MKVSVQEIIIRERVRREIGNLEPLMKSMQEHGQLNPITITRENELIAGHRRLLSALELQWTYIDATIVDSSTEAEKLQLELEENVHRKDFSPEELLAGYRRLEQLLRPPVTRRIANFFGKIFGKLFRRKKKNKTTTTAPLPTGSKTSDHVPAEQTTAESKPNSGQAQEVGEYGV